MPAKTPLDLLIGDHESEAIFHLTDLNGDGDTADAGERVVFFDETNGSGLPAPSGTILDLTQAPDGSVYAGDNPTDTVYRLRDLNGDGDANDAGEANVWFSGLPNGAQVNPAGFVLPTPNGIGIGRDGAVYVVNAGVASTPDDVVYRTRDLNADGDANDAGEANVWLDLKTLNASSSAFEISFVGDVAYITDTVGGAPDVIYRAEDKNGSGTIESGEVGVFLADGNPYGVNVEYPHDSIGETVYNMEFVSGTGINKLYALTDEDGSGTINDASEVALVWDESQLPSGYTITATPGIDAVADGSILVTMNGSTPETDGLLRLVDGNGDGDFMDAGETGVLASRADGDDWLPRPRPVEIYTPPGEEPTPELVYGGGAKDVLTADASARIFGFAGDDLLTGSAEDDELTGGIGNDRLTGAGGADSLRGGFGKDTLLGGEGQDTLDGGKGADLLFGQAGADIFVLSDEATIDTVRDFSTAQGDKVRIAIDDLLDEDGLVDASLLQTTVTGSTLTLQADLDAAAGFQATDLAYLHGVGDIGLTLLIENLAAPAV